MTDAADHLAANLRWVRERRSLSQTGLAQRSGVPRSTIANLEAGGANPTLSVLVGLSTALQLSIEEPLTPPKAHIAIVRSEQVPRQDRGRRGRAEVRHLLPEPLPGLEIDRMELAGHALIVGSPHRAGTREHLVCERGEIVLRVLAERIHLKAGDVCSFPGDQPHSYENPDEALCVAFSVVSLGRAASA